MWGSHVAKFWSVWLVIQGLWVRAALDPSFFFFFFFFSGGWGGEGSVLELNTSEPQPSTGETKGGHEKCKLSPWYDWNTVESGVKHHSVNQSVIMWWLVCCHGDAIRPLLSKRSTNVFRFERVWNWSSFNKRLSYSTSRSPSPRGI